jgi:hypothetical protein
VEFTVQSINTFGHMYAVSPLPGTISLVTVDVGTDLTLTVQGTLSPDGVACCTLVRQGMASTEKHESILRVTRFARSNANLWTAKFEVKHKACYFLSCHTGKQNLYVEINVKNVSMESVERAASLLSMDPPTFSDLAIGATGTVFYPNNAVTCTLTPINDDGSGQGESGGADKIRSARTKKEVAAASSVVSATATFTDPPANTSWAVAFAPIPVGSSFHGWYLLEASAANEGNVSASGEAP